VANRATRTLGLRPRIDDFRGPLSKLDPEGTAEALASLVVAIHPARPEDAIMSPGIRIGDIRFTEFIMLIMGAHNGPMHPVGGMGLPAHPAPASSP
jgi:hypothetical protein